MLIRSIYLILLSALYSYEVQGQQVEEVVETYFDGYQKGDSSILKTVFHPTFELKWIDPGTNRFLHVDRSGVFGFFGPNWNRHTISCRILSEGEKAASAKAVVTLVGVVEFTDYISLLKIDGRWWIVSKVSEGKRL